MEKIFGLSNMSSYSKFSEDVKCVKKQMCDFFINAKKNGKKIVGYGAAAKGNSLFNYCKIEKKDVEYTILKKLLSLHKVMILLFLCFYCKTDLSNIA